MTVSPDSFVPLALTSAPKPRNEDFHVLLAQSPEKARSLRDLAAESSGSAHPAAPTAVCQPRVMVQREGEVITGIQIHCSCGQIIDLRCAYSEPGAASAAPVPGQA